MHMFTYSMRRLFSFNLSALCALNAQSAYRLHTLNLAKYMESTHFYGLIFVHIEYARSVHCAYNVHSIIYILHAQYTLFILFIHCAQCICICCEQCTMSAQYRLVFFLLLANSLCIVHIQSQWTMKIVCTNLFTYNMRSSTLVHCVHSMH